VTQQGESIALEKLFSGGGEMGAMMRSLNWSATPLGPARAVAPEPEDRRAYYADLPPSHVCVVG
jgi:hypothetical protein